MGAEYLVIRECFYCGPRRVVAANKKLEASRVLDSIPCPTCHLDPAEIRMIEDVRERGFAQCYAEEVQRERAGKL